MEVHNKSIFLANLAKGKGVSGFTAKSVILDIKNNYGGTSYMQLRSVDFYLGGRKVHREN